MATKEGSVSTYNCFNANNLLISNSTQITIIDYEKKVVCAQIDRLMIVFVTT